VPLRSGASRSLGVGANRRLRRGNCDIGVNIDTAAVPDPDILLECLQESFAEIMALGAARRVAAG
jgi:hypothetical protein